MAKTDFKSVEQYVASQPDEMRDSLERVRAAIRKGAPKAVETISYQIPAYRVEGGTAIYFAGWKEHFSIYPVTNGLLAAFKDELRPYEILKGTIKFPHADGVPAKLIERLAKFRAEEVAANAKAKKAVTREATTNKTAPKRKQ